LFGEEKVGNGSGKKKERKGRERVGMEREV